MKKVPFSLSSISCLIPCLFCGATSLQNTQIETATGFCYHRTCTVTTYVGLLRQEHSHYCGRRLAWHSKGKRLTCNKRLTKTNRNYTQRPSSYRAVNTHRHGYKNQSVNPVQ